MAVESNPDNQYIYSSQFGSCSQDEKQKNLERLLIDQIIIYKFLGAVIFPILFRLVSSQTSTDLFLESLQQSTASVTLQSEGIKGLQMKKAYLSFQRDQMIKSVLSNVKNIELQKYILEINWLILK